MPECMYERPPPLVLSGISGRPGLAGRPGDAGGGVALGYQGHGLATWNKAEVFEAVACLGKRLGAGDAERARGGTSFVAPAKVGVQGQRFERCSTGFPLSRE
jgi:hypothetical protein